MHILVASDIHGSQAAVKRLRAVAERRNPDLIVLLGDILYHGPRNPLPEEYNPAEVARLFREWLAETSLPFMCVRGNCDAEVDAMLLPFPLAESAWIFPDGAHVMALHGHTLPSDGLLPGLPPAFVQLSGHTHIPVAEERAGRHVWNPGSVSLPKGGFPQSYGIIEKASFSVFPLAGETPLLCDVLP